MDVSIIIINYNTFDLTCQCIRSVLEKTKEVEYEIIVVDNNSSNEDTNEFLKHFQDLTLIKNDENFGFAKGNNIGIRAAKGEFILLINSDAFIENNAVKIVRDFLKSDLKVGAATGKLIFPDGKLQHNCQRFPSVTAKLFELFRVQKIFPRLGPSVLLGPFFTYDKISFPDWIWGTFFMFRKELLQHLPGEKLNDTYFMYGEDMQWCMDFKNLGYKVAFLPKPVIKHHMGGSAASKQELIKKNYRNFLKMYYPAWKVKILGWLDYLL